MLAKTDIRSLVIFIDDLDRCLPERIIETLEAIKLFMAVPKTAFVIGADPRIIRHAIATRYVRQQLDERYADAVGDEEYDLVKDYLEKLITLPYALPRLSPAEIETYINLLLCEKYLGETERNEVRGCWQSKQQEDFYAAFDHGAVIEALAGKDVPQELQTQLAWSNAVAGAITEGLKGNPRQVKRMLNAMLLRSKLADIAKLPIRSDVLAKLMVLEYTEPKRFQELDVWQTVSKGHPEQLSKLETAALADEQDKVAIDNTLSDWQKPGLQIWLRMRPPLTGIDLRDYFWIARDRTKSTLTGASLVSPHIRRLFNKLISDNEGEQQLAVQAAKELIPVELNALLSLLGDNVQHYPDQEDGPKALRLLIEEKVDGAKATLFDAIQAAPQAKMTPTVAPILSTIAQSDETAREEVKAILRTLAAKSDTPVGKAAELYLEQLNKPGAS